MELCDVYDMEGMLTGKVISRGTKLGNGENALIVFAWIFNSGGKLLMTLRHPDKKLFPSVWDIPGGGVRAGESGLEGVLREAFEEVGIAFCKGDAHLAGRRMEEHSIFEDWVFYRDISISGLALQPDEVAEARWMDLEEIRKLGGKGGMIRSLLPLYSEMFGKYS